MTIHLILLAFGILAHAVVARRFLRNASVKAPGSRAALYSDWDSTPSGIGEAAVKDVVRARMERYSAAAKKVAASAKVQVGLALLAITSLVAAPDASVRFLGTDLRASWAYAVLPFAMLYVWWDYGYSLAIAIDNRAVAWRLLDRVEGALQPNSAYSRRFILEQSILLDAWFIVFRSECFPPSTRLRSFHTVVLALHGILYAANHGLVTMLVCANVLPGALLSGGHAATQAVVLGPAVAVCAIAVDFTHTSFCVLGRNPNWLQRIAVVGAPIAIVAGYLRVLG